MFPDTETFLSLPWKNPGEAGFFLDTAELSEGHSHSLKKLMQLIGLSFASRVFSAFGSDRLSMAKRKFCAILDLQQGGKSSGNGFEFSD
jgi:hypothetical protein